jgi:UDP-N-acetylglucosamine/UDP-N-acetylgalactosamine diphosphorylase
MQETDLRRAAAEFSQNHLFAFWDELAETERADLLADLGRVDFRLVAELVQDHVSPTAAAAGLARLDPPECLPANPDDPEQRRLYADGRRRGETLIAEGKVAAMVVAGGQGTRLGFDGPKGIFPASPIKKKPLFQLFAESLLATRQRFGKAVPWYIMTSPANDQATREFFAAHSHFGLDPDDVFFFQQGVMPAVDFEGRILLAEKHRVATSPDGHGGSIRALAASGALADMARRGVEIVSYFQVDNPLVRPVDPLLCGLHELTGSQMTSPIVGKAADDERVGMFAVADGKLGVVEYSDMPPELMSARNPDGSRTYDAANVAIHVISRAFLDELTRPGSGLSLPWHRALKAVPHVDPATGQPVTPSEPNVIKFEMFVFDALPLAVKTLLVESDRAEIFSPIKNATGVDSPATARRDLVRRAARWLERCGVDVPCTPDGEPDCTLEISPLAALDADAVRDSLPTLPAIGPGSETYLGPC